MKPILFGMVSGICGAIVPANGQDVPPAGHADAGATVFKKCMQCHQIGPDAKNAIGPVLNGIVGRSAGTGFTKDQYIADVSLRNVEPWPRPIISGSPTNASIARAPAGKPLKCGWGQSPTA